MIPSYYVPGAGAPPASRQTIYADGSADAHFREGVDLELSHWVPNRTPQAFKADTSTEICFRFVENPLPGDWDLAINNHLDVDGVLSLYVLVNAEHALQHREVLVAASRMGDFWAWGEATAQLFYQGLTLSLFAEGFGAHPLPTLYARAFQRIERLLDMMPSELPETAPGLDALARAVARLESGEIARTVYHPHFVAYTLPAALVAQDLAKALAVPAFNAPLDDSSWLPPQARNRLDREKLQLVSATLATGYHHDLWYPGYRWADTPDSWAAPGFAFSGSTNGYRVAFPPLEAAVARLIAAEQAPGRWQLAEKLTPFSSLPGRNYPVVLSFVDEAGQPAASGLPPAEVAEILAAAYA